MPEPSPARRKTPKNARIVVPLKEPPPGLPVYSRIAEIRTLNTREAIALTMIYHGALGQPLNSRPVTSIEHALRFVLNLVADAAGIPAVHHSARAPVPAASAAGGL